jgi:hypothetical protein
MSCPLTASGVPITEPATTYERLWVEREVAAAFRVCPTCQAWGPSPCRTKGGRALSTPHVGRGSA